MQNEKNNVNPTDTRWDQVRDKLETAKPQLLTDAAVVRKAGSSSRDTWVVRYRDRRGPRLVQRTIYVGDANMAERVRALIHRWRAEALSPDDHRRHRLLDMVSVLAKSRGYSARARARLRAAAVEASADPRDAWKFVVRVRQDDDAFRFGKRPGRPARASLW